MGACRNFNFIAMPNGYGLAEWGRNSSPGRVKIFLFPISSTLDLGLFEHTIQWKRVGLFPQGIKLQGACS
jgi:hypothetical protein